MSASNGKVNWERSAIGRISDLHLIQRKEGINAALVIDSTDEKKTRIGEYYRFLTLLLESMPRLVIRQIMENNTRALGELTPNH